MPVTMGLCERPHTVEVDLIREIAEQMEVPEGSKVEILGGRIHVTAAPTPEHVVIASELNDQFYDQLPRYMRTTTAGAAIAPYLIGGNFAVPDLLVGPKDAFDAFGTGNRVLPAEEMELVAEVVSVSNAKKDIEVLPEVYALWRIPVYLLVDPRTADITVYSEPSHGVYGQKAGYKFCDGIELPLRERKLLLNAAEFPPYRRRIG